MVPLVSYACNWLSYNLSMLDSIKPETTMEKLEMVCFTWSNFSVRMLTLVLTLSYLGPVWTSVFVIIALSLAAILLHRSSVPPRQCAPLSLVEAQRGSALIGREAHSVATPVSLMP